MKEKPGEDAKADQVVAKYLDIVMLNTDPTVDEALPASKGYLSKEVKDGNADEVRRIIFRVPRHSWWRKRLPAWYGGTRCHRVYFQSGSAKVCGACLPPPPSRLTAIQVMTQLCYCCCTGATRGVERHPSAVP